MEIKSESQKELPYLPYLDGWRGMAIIMVLISHFFGLLPLGHFGVSVFFVLSGFLMSRILFIKKVPLTVFYRRRFARILPVFWLYMSTVFIVGRGVLGEEIHLDEFFSTMFFLRTYFPNVLIFKSHFEIGHIWSLNVEEHCYILLSLISLLAVRFSDSVARVAVTILSILCVVIFILYKFHPPATASVHSSFFIRTEVAALPLLLSCSFFLWLNKFPIKAPSITPIISLGLALVVQIFGDLVSVFLSYVTIAVLLGISINTLTVAPKWLITLLSSPVLRWFGICSYSIYLWQQIFAFSLSRYTKDWMFYDWHYYPVVGLLASILVGSLSFYFFENPMRKWLSGRPT